MTVSKKTKFNIPLILLIFVATVALLVRLYKLNQVYVFGGDEEYQATYAMTLVTDFHPIWIGVNAGHTGMYLGPFWTYFTAFWLFLAKGSPSITAFIAVFIGVLACVILYLTTKELFNHKIGIISALLYALLPLIVYYDQKFWNPSLLPLLSILLFYSLYKTYDNSRWFLIFAFLYGMVFHIHLSLIPIGLIGIITLLINIKKIGLKYIILSLVIFVLVYSPLLVFDFNSGWSNVRSPFRLKQITSFDESSKINPSFHAKALIDTLGRIWFLDSNVSSADEVLFACSRYSTALALEGSSYSERTYASLLASIISALAFILFIFNRHIRDKRAKLLIISYIVIFITSFLFFPGGAFEYYLLGVIPFVLIIWASNSEYSNKLFSNLFYSVTAIILIFSFNTLLKNKNDFGLSNKIFLIEQVSGFIGDNKFELFESGGCHTHEGWRYLFKYYGEAPGRSSAVDAKLGWLYPEEIYRGDLNYKVIVHEKRVPFRFTEDLVARFESGGFEAYIFEW